MATDNSTTNDPAPEKIGDRKEASISDYVTEASDEQDALFWVRRILASIFLPIYNRYIEGTGIERQLEKDIQQANMETPSSTFVSAAMGAGAVISIVLSSFVVLGIFYTTVSLMMVQEALGVSLLVGRAVWGGVGLLLVVLGGGAIGTLVGGTAGAGMGVIYPRVVASRRQKEIDLTLPDTVAFMYSLSVGGMSQLEVFEAVARAEDVYGETAVEFQRIARETDYFHMNYQNAIRKVAETTPSDDLNRFLIDLLSIINSGGRMDTFLENEKDYFLSEVERTQRDQMDSLEFLGEVYLSMSILPMIVLIILVVMTLMSGPKDTLLLLTVYLMIPFLNVVYLILVGVIKTDEVGDGYLQYEDPEEDRKHSDNLLSNPIVDRYTDKSSVFGMIKRREIGYQFRQFLKAPLQHFITYPRRILFFTLPLSILYFGLIILTGFVRISWLQMLGDPVRMTGLLFHAPLLMNAVPYAALREANSRTRGSILNSLTENLRKLANTNETGQPLLESIRATGENSNTLLGQELLIIYKKVRYGQPLQRALIEFNNKYHLPRLSRTVNLINRAQEASDQITPVLKTAAQASETQDDIESERKSRTRLQVFIVGVTFTIFMMVLFVLKILFVDDLVDLVSSGGATGETGQFSAANLDPNFVTTMYFHATTMQGLCAGMVSGYMSTGDLKDGVKFASFYLLFGFTIWWVVV